VSRCAGDQCWSDEISGRIAEDSQSKRNQWGERLSGGASHRNEIRNAIQLVLIEVV
jgi:hypothetical protein